MVPQRRRLASALILSAALALAACTATAEEPDAQRTVDPDIVQGDGSVVRVISQTSGTSYYPPYVMEQLGLDEKYGFELELVPSPGTQASTTLFMTRAADVGPRGWIDIGRMRESGPSMVGVTPWLQWANFVVVRADAGIDSLADLADKRIGTYSRVASEWFLLLEAVQNEADLDLTIESEIFEAEPALLTGLLEQGEIDAALVFYNVAMQLVLDESVIVLANSNDLAVAAGLPQGSLSSYWAFDVEYAEEHPDNVTAFIAAVTEAMVVLQDDDDIWIDMLATQGVTDTDLAAALRDWTRDVISTEWPSDVEADIQAQFDLFTEIGGTEVVGLNEPPDDVVDVTFSP